MGRRIQREQPEIFKQKSPADCGVEADGYRKFSDPVLNTKILPVCGILVVKGKNTAMTGGVFAGKVKKKAKNPNYFN